jgi:hypothetical protein
MTTTASNDPETKVTNIFLSAVRIRYLRNLQYSTFSNQQSAISNQQC